MQIKNSPIITASNIIVSVSQRDVGVLRGEQDLARDAGVSRGEQDLARDAAVLKGKQDFSEDAGVLRGEKDLIWIMYPHLVILFEKA